MPRKRDWVGGVGFIRSVEGRERENDVVGLVSKAKVTAEGGQLRRMIDHNYVLLGCG